MRIADRRNLLKRLAVLLVTAAMVSVGGLAVWSPARPAGADAPGPPSPSIGDVVNRPVPKSIATLPLENQQGQPMPLGDLRGRVVLLAPFLTSCQEECPITTGALLLVHRTIVRDHLSKKVAIVEVTVDPARDTPQRMAAYARLTGSSWPLLTGSSSDLATLWHHFGVYYQTVPESSPAGIDWETHLPYTYDVDHSDGFILLDADQHERFLAGGMTRVANIPQTLQRLLDREGKANLRDPGGGTWTVNDALGAIRWALGR